MGNYYLYQIAYFITRALPVKFAYALAVLLADAHYFLSPKDRLAVEENLKVALKTTHVKSQDVRAVFHNFGKYLVDFFTMSKRVNKEFLKTQVDVKNAHYLDAVLKGGKGGIVISAHIGNWEAGSAFLSLLGYPFAVVALTHEDKRVNAFFNAQREAFGTTVIQTNVAIRRVTEQLKKNRFVAMLVERDFGKHGLAMDFLGRTTMIPKGAVVFSLKTGAPLIPCFIMRLDNDRYEVDLREPIVPDRLNDGAISDDEIRVHMKKYLGIMEDQLRRYPTQWLMFREFWAK